MSYLSPFSLKTNANLNIMSKNVTWFPYVAVADKRIDKFDTSQKIIDQKFNIIYILTWNVLNKQMPIWY